MQNTSKHTLFTSLCILGVFLLCFLPSKVLFSQQVYEMSNNEVEECYGIFTDSNNGEDTNCDSCYDHDENYTFTICVPNGDSIIMVFQSFQTEPIFDTIRFFDGPDTNSVQIGPTHSGEDIPGPIIATSGCLTIHFGSDGSVAAEGWMAEWYTIIAPPDTPQITIDPVLDCESETFLVQLDMLVLCDSLLPNWVSLNGPSGSEVVAVNPLNCQGGVTQAFTVSLSPSLNENGNYTVNLTSFYLDVCDSLHVLFSETTFDVVNCPLEVEVFIEPDVVCEGGCVEVWAEVEGGIPATYVFDWNIAVPATAGPHNFCPAQSQWIVLTVSDNSGASPGTDSVWVTVIQKPETQSDFGICQSEPPFNLTANPTGGFWLGNGVDSSGFFTPNDAGGGIHELVYEIGGCTDTMYIDILGIFPGPPQAACPGTAPFQLTGAYPAAGVWSGTNVTPDGIFDPAFPGTFEVEFHYDTCVAVKEVNVENVAVQATDTICVVDSFYFLSGTPVGGLWSGPGVVNALTGKINLYQAGAGTHEYVYSLSGCSDTAYLHVKITDAGNNFTVCPQQSPFNIPPASPLGGIWSGNGLLDPVSGLFDPGYNNGNNFNADMVYTVDGCSDTIRIRGRNTSVSLDSIFTCLTDTAFRLTAPNTGRIPGGGSWSGTGVVTGPPRFDPAIAGPGIHTVYYTANTCVDSFKAVVYPPADFQLPAQVCENIQFLDLNDFAPPGSWTGEGVFPQGSSSFMPGVAGVGTHQLAFVSAIGGCPDTTSIEVVPLPEPIGILPSDLCYKDEALDVFLDNTNINISGNGIVNGSQFNPSVAGAGIHQLNWELNSNVCQTSGMIEVTVFPPLVIEPAFTDTAVCFGEKVLAKVKVSGGLGSGYVIDWNNGEMQGDSFLYDAPFSGDLFIEVTDGCSEPATADVSITVHPEITATFQTNEPLCYGETGFAEVSVQPADAYVIEWQVDPVVSGSRLDARVRNTYNVLITNPQTGCSIMESVYLPGFELLSARFMPNPGNDCATMANPEIEFMDVSVGATQGTWNFGDGRTKAYLPGDFHIHSYADTGTYTVSLQVSNEGGCTDSYELEVCVRAVDVLFVPNAFVPGGVNSRWQVVGYGIDEFELKIFDRWGKIIFETRNINEGWDGQHKGYDVPMGGYPYVIRFRNPVTGAFENRKGVLVVYR